MYSSIQNSTGSSSRFRQIKVSLIVLYYLNLFASKNKNKPSGLPEALKNKEILHLSKYLQSA